MPDWLLQIGGMTLGMASTAAGIYAAIKADLATLHVKADQAAQRAEKAHERIDHLLQR